MVKDSSSIAPIQHLSKTVPKQVAQHLEAHCTIMWMRPRFETTHEEDLKQILISFCAVPPKLSKVAGVTFKLTAQNTLCRGIVMSDVLM